ncbi:MAG: hypothetical protein HGA93_01810 [Methanothrix sp.]|nr:hypothetical protein [Methanothrix sp.]
MKTFIIEILAIFSLVTPVLAMINDLPTSLNTTEDLLRFSEISREAGMAQAGGLLATYEYSSHQIGYDDYCKAITNANHMIRDYNLMLEGLFNKTVSSRMRITEFYL